MQYWIILPFLTKRSCIHFFYVTNHLSFLALFLLWAPVYFSSSSFPHLLSPPFPLCPFFVLPLSVYCQTDIVLLITNKSWSFGWALGSVEIISPLRSFHVYVENKQQAKKPCNSKFLVKYWLQNMCIREKMLFYSFEMQEQAICMQ